MKRLKRFAKNFWISFWRPEMLILPGQLAFFFILSIVPILTLISYGASGLNLPISFISEFITKSFGQGISELIVPIVSIDHISISFFITLLTGYIIASNGASSIIIASNTVYHIKDKGFLYRRIKAFIMTLFIVLLFLFILIVPLFGNKIIDAIKYVNLNSTITKQIEIIFTILKGPISWLIIFIFIKILYTMAPDKKIPSREVNYGAVFTSVGWIIATAVYSYYINNYAHYSVFYGGLANLVILLLWLYLLAYIFVIGIAMNNHEETEKINQTAKIDLDKLMPENTTIKHKQTADNKSEVKNPQD